MREGRRGGLKTVAYKWQKISKYDPCPRLLKIRFCAISVHWCVCGNRIHPLGWKSPPVDQNPFFHTTQNTASNVKLVLAALAAHRRELGAERREFGKSAKSSISTGTKHQLQLWKWISKTISIVRGRGNTPSLKSHHTESMTTVLPAYYGQQLMCKFSTELW